MVSGAFADVSEDARNAMDDGSWRKAIILLKKYPDDPDARRLLGISYFKSRDYELHSPW